MTLRGKAETNAAGGRVSAVGADERRRRATSADERRRLPRRRGDEHTRQSAGDWWKGAQATDDRAQATSAVGWLQTTASNRAQATACSSMQATAGSRAAEHRVTATASGGRQSAGRQSDRAAVGGRAQTSGEGEEQTGGGYVSDSRAAAADADEAAAADADEAAADANQEAVVGWSGGWSSDTMINLVLKGSGVKQLYGVSVEDWDAEEIRAGVVAGGGGWHGKELIGEKLVVYNKATESQAKFHVSAEFDSSCGPAWHCIVGTSFGSYVTHTTGGFLYFSIDKVYILLFKTAVEPLDH
ncbi:Dynein light chain 1 [Nymphaea thermarum]|nr:Dynein light chain 1 [Nymphaea thermarum]